MAKKPVKLTTIAARPIDCTPGMVSRFFEMVMAGGEVPIENLQRGVPMSERLFFTGAGDTIMGVTAIRYPQQAYHRSLFKQAGVPQMFNPDSIEVVWLYVDPKYRGLGVWKHARDFRLDFMAGRPSHAIHRVENDLVSPLIEKRTDYIQAGAHFKSPSDDHMLKLVVRNHDAVYDKTRKFNYGKQSS